jgi:F-type H+-transporting ATPase subunit epsilon
MADKTFHLTIISPDRTFYENDVTMLEFTSSEGELGVYAEHVPTTTVLLPGIATIHAVDGVKKAALHSGFVEILKDRVTILAEVAEWPEEIDINRANEARIRAERRLGGNGTETTLDVDRAELALKRALTRIRILG